MLGGEKRGGRHIHLLVDLLFLSLSDRSLSAACVDEGEKGRGGVGCSHFFGDHVIGALQGLLVAVVVSAQDGHQGMIGLHGTGRSSIEQ